MSTQTLPTNRKNEIHYGPKTLKEAKQLIGSSDLSAVEIRQLISKMKDAGYGRAAAAVRKEYLG